MQIIDAQIHLWTNDLAPQHHRKTPLTIDGALREMDAAGVHAALVHPPNWDPDANAYAVEAALAHPDRFATLGSFPLDETTTEDSVDRLMAMPGMKGMRFILPLPDVQPLLAAGKLEWLWAAADARALPMGLFILPQQIDIVSDIASRYPRMRLLIDHLGVPPFARLPEAGTYIDALLRLAPLPNIAVKATAVPGFASDAYPFASTHQPLRRVFDAFGAERMFWGTDITRLQATWQECVNLFVKELDWLQGSDLDAVMGRALRDWIGWT